MKKIQRLIKDMCYELDAAEHYAKHALRNKDEDKELGDVYERVARQELDHCEMFHAQAVRLIREHAKRRTRRAVPSGNMSTTRSWSGTRRSA